MKLVAKLLLLLLVVAVSGPYFIKGPDGAPLWSLRDTARSLQSAFADLRQHTPVVGSSGASESVEVYRWQDASGQWHFTNVAPDAMPHSILRIDARTNAISIGVTREPAEQQTQAAEPAVQTGPLDTHIGPLPDPATARRLIEDARALQAQAEARAAVLNNPD